MPSANHPIDTYGASESLMTRRSAIARVGAVGVAGTALLALGSVSSASATSSCLNRMAHSDWQRLVGHEFRVLGSDLHEDEAARRAHAVLTLHEAADRSFAGDIHRPAHLRASAISLLFIVHGTTDLPNATYIVHHRELGLFPLFLHARPRGEHAGVSARLYESVMN